MIFELKQKKNKFLEETYKKSMKELNDFYDIDWAKQTPKVMIINNRETIDRLLGRKTEDWLVGWADFGNTLYLLNPLKYKTESSHTYKKESYAMLVKHELSHLFFRVLIKQGYTPIWLNEGVAIHLSGQNKFKKEIQEFKNFLNYYDEKGKGVYIESGFFIERLVNKFGKDNLLKLLKSLKDIKNKQEFDVLFFKIFKFKLNYKEINKVYLK